MTRQTETALFHGMADVEPGVRLHYVTAGEGDRTAVLLHGFPQIWYAWHGFIPRLTAAGFRVIAPKLSRRRQLVASARWL
jgi:pimeloyl-ACP methyl ester carboxylesterase